MSDEEEFLFSQSDETFDVMCEAAAQLDAIVQEFYDHLFAECGARGIVAPGFGEFFGFMLASWDHLYDEADAHRDHELSLSVDDPDEIRSRWLTASETKAARQFYRPMVLKACTAGHKASRKKVDDQVQSILRSIREAPTDGS